jgi:hypothetical protein
MTGLRVRFVDDRSPILSRLEIEGPRDRELLGALLRALFELRIQVVQCEARIEPHLLAALTLVEFDAAPIGSKRRAQVQATVLDVLEQSAARSRASARRVEVTHDGSGDGLATVRAERSARNLDQKQLKPRAAQRLNAEHFQGLRSHADFDALGRQRLASNFDE